MLDQNNELLELKPNTELLILYKNAKLYLSNKLDNTRQHDYFTPHDSAHSYAIESIINLILKSKSELFSDLSELEKFLLLLSIWGHDIGMTYEVSKEYFEDNYYGDVNEVEKRKKHDLISSWFLSKH